MSPKTLRLIGLLSIVVAAALSVLNLKRVANTGTFWITMPLLLFGVILVARARRR